MGGVSKNGLNCDNMNAVRRCVVSVGALTHLPIEEAEYGGDQKTLQEKILKGGS